MSTLNLNETKRTTFSGSEVTRGQLDHRPRTCYRANARSNARCKFMFKMPQWLIRDEYQDAPEPFDPGEKIYVAKIDKLFDSMLPVIQRVIVHNGMDPMELPDFSTHILPLPGKLKGKMEFTEGWLQELSKLKRTKHVKLTYADKRMIVEMNLGFDVLDFNYSYLFKYLLVKRVGDVYGRFQRLDCRVLLTIDLEHYKVYLNAIKFQGVGKFDVKFEGHVSDPLLNIAAKAVTSLFRRQVLVRVEERGLKLFRLMIDDFNKKIPLPDRLSYLSALKTASLL